MIWKLRTTMNAADVTTTIERALVDSRLDGGSKRPRLLSVNGFSYVASDLATWLGDRGMAHLRAARPITRRPRARSSAGIRR